MHALTILSGLGWLMLMANLGYAIGWLWDVHGRKVRVFLNR